MKAIGLILFLLVHARSQLIFPDDTEPTNPLPISPTWPRRPFPTLSIPNIPPPPLPSSAAASFQPNDRTNVFNQVEAKKTPLPPQNAVTTEEQYWTNHVNKILSHGVTQFTLHMDRAIDVNQRATTVGTDRDNVVFSPLNLASTLAVVLLGSAGKTFDEIVKILGLESGIDISGHSEIVHQMFGLMLNSIKIKSQATGLSRSPEVFVAGGIFVQEGYPIRQQFSTIARDTYKNDVIGVDFRNQPRAAQNLINNWINSRTQGKIRNILLEPPEQATKVILASALYFNGEWNRHFVESATKKKPFYTPSGHTVIVDMMYNAGEFRFYEDRQLGVKILGLPYKSSHPESMTFTLDGSQQFETTMYLLLPTSTNANALTELESKLTPEIIDSLINNMVNQTCIIAVPKMKLSSTLSLNRALQSLGLTSLFTPGVANLGLLSPGLNNTVANDFIFSRINNVESTTATSASARDASLARKKNYIRYEDKVGGYLVQQWNNGVYLEKIRSASRKRREAFSNTKNKAAVEAAVEAEAPRNDRYSDTISNEDKDRAEMIGVGEHRSELSQRHKRQGRPIDDGFIKFIESKKFPSNGLDALRNGANLSNPGLYASDVLHKVEIDITETGTVAASATSVVIQRSGDQRRFVANRPFIFFIRHDPTNLMLFWGSVNKPSPNYPAN